MSRRGRPKGSVNADIRPVRDAIQALRKEYSIMTVRQVFYALTVRGIVEKTENGYRQVQGQILNMRRQGVLPWGFIADSTRWQRKPESFDGLDDALRATLRGYRHNLWRSQSVRIEVWLEKDALAGIVMEATDPWDVALMVSRGQSSDTFCYQAAQNARHAYEHNGTITHVFALYDWDKSGRNSSDTIRHKLREYSDDTPIVFERLGVNQDQIRDWGLPTRWAKDNASEIAVELDAIPPNRLIQLVEDAIMDLIDPAAWHMEEQVERSEREILARIIEAAA